MTKPPDKVQILKRESAAGGGDPADNDDFFTEAPLDPNEDAIEVQGVYFQTTVSGTSDETTYIARNGDDMVFRDEAVGEEATLTQLLTGSGIASSDELVKVSSNDTAAGYLSTKLVAGSGIALAEVDDGSDETFEISCTVSGGGVGGISETQHKALRHLIHFVDEGPAGGFSSGAYKEVLPAGNPFPTSIIWWESSSKTQKIVEKTITRSGGGATVSKPTPIIWKIYDDDGTTILATATDTVVYSGVFETSRTRTIS